MAREVDMTDVSALSDDDLDYAHERYMLSEAAWLEELERRGIEKPAWMSEPAPAPLEQVNVDAPPEAPAELQVWHKSMTNDELRSVLVSREYEVAEDATKAQMIEVLEQDDAERAAKEA